MQSATECLPLIVASRTARTFVEGPQDFEGSTLGESGFFMLHKGKGGANDCGDLIRPHSYPPAAEPLEQLCDFSGDALLNWRAVFANNG